MEKKIEKTPEELERAELNLLVKRGVQFDIRLKILKREKGFKGHFKKPIFIEKTKTFEVQELTLDTLDRLSDIWLDMPMSEADLQDENNVLSVAKRIVKDNAKRMARIIAIAVLGEDYYITEQLSNGRMKRRTDEKELNRLADLFFHTIKPSQLITITAAITNVSYLSDFLNSMRLMSGARTTRPIVKSIE